MLNRGPGSLWSLKIPGCPSKIVAVWPWHPGQTSPLASDHHGLLIIPIHWLTSSLIIPIHWLTSSLMISIHWLASSLCLLSISKLVCGGCSGAIWLPSHHPGGCCTLVVVEEISPDDVERFEYPEMRYINVKKYCYYYKAAVLSVGCASFSSTLFPSTQLSVKMLEYSTLWTASLAMNVCGLPSLWRVSMIVFWTTVRSAVFPMIV